MNVATLAPIASALLLHAGELVASRRGPSTVHLESCRPCRTFARSLEECSEIPLWWTDDRDDCNALDQTLNELVFSEPDVDLQVVTLPIRDGDARIVCADDLPAAIGRIGAVPAAAWETSYVVVRSIDIDTVAGLRPKCCGASDGERSRRVHYREGGIGPAVLVVPPFGIDPGYFAGIVGELLRDHQVIMWESSGNDTAVVAQDAVDAGEILVSEGVERFHLVTWCGGVRLAARLADACGPRLRSITLFAPELDTEDNQTEGYRSLARFFQQFNASGADVEQIATNARKGWQERLREAPSANLDQYAAHTSLQRSPLQYHPTDFSSKVSEDLFGDTKRILNMAQTVICRGDVRLVAERLVAHDGPILVVSGTADHLIKYSGVKDHCERAERWTLVTVLGGNHYTLHEHGPALGRLLRPFFRDGCIIDTQPRRVTASRMRFMYARRDAAAGSPAAVSGDHAGRAARSS
jgi:pimeloyl-ACP methyl ester carboxylesterase